MSEGSYRAIAIVFGILALIMSIINIWMIFTMPSIYNDLTIRIGFWVFFFICIVIAAICNWKARQIKLRGW